jgi:hypothetical protein
MDSCSKYMYFLSALSLGAHPTFLTSERAAISSRLNTFLLKPKDLPWGEGGSVQCQAQ